MALLTATKVGIGSVDYARLPILIWNCKCDLMGVIGPNGQEKPQFLTDHRSLPSQ